MDNPPVINVVRLAQIANRLEVMRGMSDASARLLSRLLARYNKIVIRDFILNRDFIMTDLGAV